MIFTYPNNDDEYPQTVCKLEESDIDNVKMFKYLGTNIHFREYTTGDAEISQRIESAEWKFYEHVRKFMNFKIALSTRVSILNAVVRSRLMYGCHDHDGTEIASEQFLRWTTEKNDPRWLQAKGRSNGFCIYKRGNYWHEQIGKD